MIPKENPNELPITLSVIVTHKRDSPCLELRKNTTDQDLIKLIISSAFHERPLVIQPVFTNKMQSLNSLVDKGLIYRDENTKDFYFTF